MCRRLLLYSVLRSPLTTDFSNLAPAGTDIARLRNDEVDEIPLIYLGLATQGKISTGVLCAHARCRTTSVALGAPRSTAVATSAPAPNTNPAR